MKTADVIIASLAAESVVATTLSRRTVNAMPAEGFDEVAREEPLEIRVRGQAVAVTMRTPGHDIELAAGFLLSEGLIKDASDIGGIAHCKEIAGKENVVNVLPDPAIDLDLARLTRHVFASSSCGLCGKASIDSIHQHFPPIAGGCVISEQLLAQIPGVMRAEQSAFARTGGLHAAGIFDATGRCIVVREDVGRHNAVDKVAGHVLLRGLLPLRAHILLVSGRASFEIMQKALAAGIEIVCAVSAPSSLAIEFARESNQTLVGFLRGNGMNVYSGEERVAGAKA